jgi:hypothetical protein
MQGFGVILARGVLPFFEERLAGAVLVSPPLS